MASDSHAELIMEGAEHSLHSSQREALLEHLFTGEVMRRLWLRGVYDLEVLKPQVDDSGYDLVFETRSIVRHVQLKSTRRGSSLRNVKVQLHLASKPSGCVVIIEFDNNLHLGPFYWFGNPPGEKLPDISSFPVARHAKANSQGDKLQRPNIKQIPRSMFQKLDTIEDIIEYLFGTSLFERAPGRSA